MRRSLLPLLASLLSVSAADFLPPAEAVRTFHVGDPELKWEFVLAEPDIAQPVFLNWDAMGRLWVCEYRQYPAPAGLEPVSHDEFWRTVYDRVPPPPPQAPRGADRISIHEDTNGDGTYDKHTVFADGLSLCTAVEHGFQGHYVLQPPYLLYYADTDRNDLPDGPPEVLLSGFGIEDSHSVANSLRWGPDGWLYGAHGSTVTSHLKRPADTKPVVDMIGQGVWRYHPHTKQVEVFAEGGGNTFGLEFDAQGRLFSGHNGGDTRGFHYTQGAYLRKGFEKHGQLSNPYAYGFFEAMASDKTERFTHNFIIYENGALGSKYEGKLFGIEPLQRRLVLSQRYPDGSTFGTRDLSRIVTCDDPWFRPVDIKAGPDGAIYVADFHEPEISHVKHRTGPVAKETGRIWRLRGKELASRATPVERDHPISSKQLHSANKTLRQLALSFLREKHFARKGYPNRQMPDPVPQNASLTEAETAVFLWNWMKGQPAYQDADLPVHELEHFWLQSAMDQRGFLVKQLSTPNAAIRNWAVRLLCDCKTLSPDELETFLKMAPVESDGEVRLQLAASTCRLPREYAWPILLELLRHPEDAADPRIPLMLWWAMEDKLIEAENQIVSVFTKRNRALVKEVIAPRIFKRLAQTGTAASLQMYAFLLV